SPERMRMPHGIKQHMPMTSQCPPDRKITESSVQTVERRVVLLTTENHKPTAAKTPAYTSQAATNRGRLHGFRPPVITPRNQMSPIHSQPQRTLRTLPAHLP